MSTLYFVDGYHGGIEGHMPEGSWQDILHAMEEHPYWKLSLEIEPESWEYIRIHDAQTYGRLCRFFREAEPEGRVEFINGSYGQPFCWAINGESNIRQLMRGIEIIKRHFPQVVIDTYACQEPCFTSALPQIVKSLGYVRMSLKNPTAWGGYMAKMPGDIVLLQSSDGSALPAVTRYECEELVSCSATEAAGYDYPSIAAFAAKCEEQGIRAPAGMCLQDLGWSSHPLLSVIDVRYTTWREYFREFGSLAKQTATYHQEDILVALPWGNRILTAMLRNVRRAENRILQTEKLLAIAQSQREVNVGDRLLQAWDCLMQAQHHDGYICATTGEGRWATRSNALVAECEKLLDQVGDLAMSVPAHADTDEEEKADMTLRVYNTVGSCRESQAECMVGLYHGYRSVAVVDGQGEPVPCQITPVRQYADGSLGAMRLNFPARLQGVGYRDYLLIPMGTSSVEATKIARKTVQDTVEVYTGLYEIVFDLNHGGAIARLYDKRTGRDYASNLRSFGALRGYFVGENAFLDTMGSRVSCEFKENGPLCARLLFKGRLHGANFSQTITIREGEPRIDCEVSVHFSTETEIGYPYAPTEEEKFYGVKRSSCREDYKLGVQMPLGPNPVRIYKSAPYDVYESRLQDTRFDAWTEIKHNIVNGFIDFYEPVSDTGLAVFCDCVNGYSFVDNHFALTLAFGYHANFWWGYQPLKGTCTLGYSLLPHMGDWERGNVPYGYQLYREPLLIHRLTGKPEPEEHVAFACQDPSVETVTLLKQDGRFLARLFHAGSDEQPLRIAHRLSGFESGPVTLQGDALQAGSPIGPMQILTMR